MAPRTAVSPSPGSTFADRYQLLSTAEAQAILQVSKSKFWDFVNSGALPTIRDGGILRIKQSDLADFIDARRESGPSVAPQRAQNNPYLAERATVVTEPKRSGPRESVPGDGGIS